MDMAKSYAKQKQRLLKDTEICDENRKLFKKFLDWEEYKLKRKLGKPSLDDSSFKTVIDYCFRLRTVNRWFKNKPWKKLTKKDIKKVYDDLEDGKIISSRGGPYKNRASYYNKIFKSKPFEMAGKKEIAREVMEFFENNHDSEVRFIELEDFKKLLTVTIYPKQKFLLWLAWDIGENISALLKLRKKNFVKQENENKEIEYIVNLPKDILKRSRRERSEINNFRETAEFADIILEPKEEEDLVFDFGYGQAKKFLDRVVRLTKIKCKPKGQRVTWKDLRSSMACYLLKDGWTSDEVNSRLGHRPSSTELDKYINFSALDKREPKKKIYESNLRKIEAELENSRELSKLQSNRLEKLKEKSEIQDKEITILKENTKGLPLNLLKEIGEMATKGKIILINDVKGLYTENKPFRLQKISNKQFEKSKKPKIVMEIQG